MAASDLTVIPLCLWRSRKPLPGGVSAARGSARGWRSAALRRSVRDVYSRLNPSKDANRTPRKSELRPVLLAPRFAPCVKRFYPWSVTEPSTTRPPPGPDLATSHPDDAIANGRGYLQRQMRSSSPAARSQQNSRASTPTGRDPRSRDRAVDQQHPRSCTGARPRPRRHLMTAASRAHEKTRRGCRNAARPPFARSRCRSAASP